MTAPTSGTDVTLCAAVFLLAEATNVRKMYRAQIPHEEDSSRRNVCFLAPNHRALSMRFDGQNRSEADERRYASMPQSLEPPAGDARVVNGVLWIAVFQVILHSAKVHSCRMSASVRAAIGCSTDNEFFERRTQRLEGWANVDHAEGVAWQFLLTLPRHSRFPVADIAKMARAHDRSGHSATRGRES